MLWSDRTSAFLESHTSIAEQCNNAIVDNAECETLLKLYFGNSPQHRTTMAQWSFKVQLCIKQPLASTGLAVLTNCVEI